MHAYIQRPIGPPEPVRMRMEVYVCACVSVSHAGARFSLFGNDLGDDGVQLLAGALPACDTIAEI
jgi:hypothetical protein